MTTAGIRFTFTAGSSFLDPLLRRQGEAIQTRLGSKPSEFDGFKTGVFELLPEQPRMRLNAARDRFPAGFPANLPFNVTFMLH